MLPVQFGPRAVSGVDDITAQGCKEQARPTLPEILSFRIRARNVNLAQQIGTHGTTLGVLLLEDESGAIVDGIASGCKDFEDTNREILTRWLQGSGIQPVTWSTLTEKMRKAGLFELASEVDKALNLKKREVPLLLPGDPEDVDGAMPEGISVVCTVKAEFSQYPHGSRQDCWAIVSTKAAKITKKQAVDIIAVIDNSGSMAGTKLHLVKEMLQRLINQLDERDRIALLTYNTVARQHFGLLEATAENKKIFRDAVSSITAQGRTNLCDGLIKGIETLAYHRGSKPALVQSVLVLSDGEATEGVTSCDKVLMEMDQIKCYTGSVYTFAFGKDCDYQMMESIAIHGKGVCYFIDSLEKIAPSFGNCLGGLQTVVAQNISVHIEMQDDNRINKLHCHDAVQWIKEDKICDIPIGDIQCGEEKCVALTLVLPRLMEEKLDTVLKGTLSYFDTGLAEDRSEHFQLNISRADGVCNEKPNYAVDQQRNRVLTIEALNNLSKSENYQKARNHISELISTISASVSCDSLWTKKLLSELKNCIPLSPQDEEWPEHHKRKNKSSRIRKHRQLHSASSQHRETDLLLDIEAYDLSEEEPEVLCSRLKRSSRYNRHGGHNGEVEAQSGRPTCGKWEAQSTLSMSRPACTSEPQEGIFDHCAAVPKHSDEDLMLKGHSLILSLRRKSRICAAVPNGDIMGSAMNIEQTSSAVHTSGSDTDCSLRLPKSMTPTSDICAAAPKVHDMKSAKNIKQMPSAVHSSGSSEKKSGLFHKLRSSLWPFSQVTKRCSEANIAHEESETEMMIGTAILPTSAEGNYATLEGTTISKQTLYTQGMTELIKPEDSISTNWQRQVPNKECAAHSSEYSMAQVYECQGAEERDESMTSEYSERDELFSDTSAIAINSILHTLMTQRANRVGACMYQTPPKDEMEHKIVDDDICTDV